MKRWLFTILSALSLLLFVVVVVIWVRSYWVWHRLHLNAADQQSMYEVGVSRGVINLDVHRVKGDRWLYGGELGWEHIPWEPNDLMARKHNYGYADRELDFRWRGFGLLALLDADGSGRWIFYLPCWFACAVVLLPPLIWVRQCRLLRRSRRMSLCPCCGYDLRATPERCPECGTTAVAREYNGERRG